VLLSNLLPFAVIHEPSLRRSLSQTIADRRKPSQTNKAQQPTTLQPHQIVRPLQNNKITTTRQKYSSVPDRRFGNSPHRPHQRLLVANVTLIHRSSGSILSAPDSSEESGYAIFSNVFPIVITKSCTSSCIWSSDEKATTNATDCRCYYNSEN
jgi:hypothetical protein